MKHHPPTDRELLERIDKRVRIACVVGFVWFMILTAAVFGQSNSTYAAADADRQQFPKSDWPFLYYITTDNQPEAKQLTVGRTAAFVVSSFSTSVVLEHHLPVEVSRGLWRIDTRTLNWRWSDWYAVLKRYPYRPDRFPSLVVRADWLIVELSDNAASNSGYLLLYGGKPPATRDEFLKFWQVTLKGTRDPLLLARVEKDSDGDSPSLYDVRRIENRPVANRGYAFGTEDNDPFNVNAKTDPLERLLSNRVHDAEEWIVGFPVISNVSGAGGTKQAYLLVNGRNGKRQDEAPIGIVRDTTRFRGRDAIRTSGSCIQCHPRGINAIASNDLRDLIASGEELYADKKSQELIEQQYLADLRLQVEIARAQEDYTMFVALCTGWSPEENARAFKEAVDNYDADLTIEDAARELYCSPRELELAFGYWSDKTKLGARLAGLPHGRSVSRPYFESVFDTAYFAVKGWRAVAR